VFVGFKIGNGGEKVKDVEGESGNVGFEKVEDMVL
jgi:hypothetical protein